VAPGGNGIEWGEERNIPAETLYAMGKMTDITYDDMIGFAQQRMTDTAGACELLGCSRQYINQLVREGKLTPIRTTSNNNLFLKSDIESESLL
jgi:excisionase family DNA binding protein